MRILYHHRTRAEDAQGVHIYEMVNAFRQLGHEVKIVSIVGEGHIKEGEKSESRISRFAARLPPMGYELLEIFYNLYGLLSLAKEVIKFHPDFIYERYSLYNMAGILVSKLCGIPLLLEVNSPLYLEKEKYGNLAFRSLARIFERWICSNSYKTVVVSTPLKNILRGIGVPGDHMVVVPNGINPGLFNRDQIKTDIRDQLGLDSKIVLGFVGWFRKWHGLEDLLRIYVDYGMKEKNIHLLLIGDGPAYKDLELFARQNEIMGTGVTFTGNLKREKVPEYIASFDLAIQPDVTDYASPIKVFEYMAMGKGVIAPNRENIKEIVKSDYPGLFEAGDWKDMARTILKYAQSKEKTRELGEQAKNILNEQKYFWLDNARKTLALLKK